MKNLYTSACKCLFAVVLLLISNQFLCAQTYQWAKGFGVAGQTCSGQSIATDAAGNVYTTGSFYGTIDFDPGAGITNLTSAGGNDIFISKLDASGNFVWAKSMGSTSYDQGYGIAVDAAGNVYTTGYFSGTVDFDPGTGIANLVSAGSYDVFISKLDANGNYLWAKSIGGTSADEGLGIAVDAANNVYTTGSFYGTIDFDPGAGTAYLNGNTFVCKLDANGNYVWANTISPGTSNTVNAIAVDAAGNVYTTGLFSGSYTLVNQGNFDIFIWKLNSAGNYVWAKDLGGTSFDWGEGITTDAAGNVYTTGFFQGTADFDPGAGTANLTSVGGYNIFVSKLDGSGNYLWAKNLGTGNGYKIVSDAAGNIYTTGGFSGSADFDPGTGTAYLTSAGGSDIFVSKLDASGNYLWAKGMGGAGSDYPNAIAIDTKGNIFTTGQFAGTADFDPNAGTANLVANGTADIFISKLAPPLPGGVAGAVYWQKANSLSLADAAAVTTWTNNTAGGNSFAPTAGSVTFSNAFANWINFNPSVTLDATGTLSANSFIGTNTYTSAHIFTVKTPTAAAAYNSNEGVTTSGTSLGYFLPWSGDNKIYWDMAATRIYTGATPTNEFGTNLWSFYGDNASTAGYSPANTVTAIRQNGAIIVSGQSPSYSVNFTGNNSPQKLTGQGNVAEVIEYLGAALTATKINQIESYLSVKYGLSLDQTAAQNYTASDGTTIVWNGTTGSTSGFKNNIFGIGTDAGSSLDQRISRSTNTVGSSGNALLTVATGNDFTSANSDSRAVVGTDKQFLMIADNGLAVTALTGSAPYGKIAVLRQWQVQSSLTTSTAVLQFDVDNSTGDIPLGPSAATYYMLYNAAGGTNFTSATVVPLTLTAAGLWSTTTAVALANGSTFTIATSAVPATGLNFDGVNDNVSFGSAITTALAASNKITVEAWVNPATNTGGLGELVGNYNWPTSNNLMQFLLRQENGDYRFWVSDGTGFKSVVATGAVVVNTWQHVAGVWNGTDIRIYVNGVLIGITTGVTGTAFAATTNTMVMGTDGGGELFKGSLDEVHIWNRPLCQAEIQNNMNTVLSPTGQTGLLALYHFNQGNIGAVNTGITTLSDTTGNGNTGTLNNFALTGTASNWVAGTVTGVPTTYVPATLAGTAGAGTVSQLVTVNALGTYFQDVVGCGLIAKVLPSGTSPVTGNINTKVTIDASVKSYHTTPYVQRHYDIEPATSASTATATVTLYYTQAEFTAYNTARGTQPALPTSSADATGIANLRISQFHGTGTAPGNYTGTGVLINPSSVGTVVWNSTLSRWEVTIPVSGFSGFYAQTSAFLLPVTLISFSGYNNNTFNYLQWVSAAEQDFAYYQLERSEDGINFSSTATIAAQASSSSSDKTYNYSDDISALHQTVFYYRLKMYDQSGVYKYSDVIKINTNSKGFTMNASPNPFAGQLKVQVTVGENQQATLVLKGIDGKTIAQQHTLLTKGSNTVLMNSLDNLPNGLYMLSFVNDEGTTTIKVIKQQ